MLRFVYSLIFTLLLPLVLLRLLWRSIKAPDYRRRLGERFGLRVSPAIRQLLSKRGEGQPILWVHAVSVGEAVAARPLITALLETEPKLLCVVTTMTPTGAARVSTDFQDQQRVAHGYLPYDIGWTLALFFRVVKPSLLLLMETELWPNLIAASAGRNVPVVLANARLSARSAESYARLPGLTRAMLGALHHIAAQSDDDARRFIELGADARRVSVTGSLKFYIEDAKPQAQPDPQLDALRDSGRWIILAASTREGEEAKVLDAFAKVRASVGEALLLLVPRHPERFDAVARLCESRGMPPRRRSQGTEPMAADQVFLGDSMGEMQRYIALADVAFVGGSLVDTGCQSVLEPAAAGLPIITGPSQFNFQAICRELEQAGGLTTVPDQDGLASVLLQLHEQPGRRAAMGRNAARFVDQNRQALPMLTQTVQALLAASSG